MTVQNNIAAAPPAVYAKIAAVQADMAKHGISKDRENSFDRYRFRGIDDVYNALSPILAKHGLNILPRIIERVCQERTSKKGEPMFYVTVTAEFDLIAAEDGSVHTIRTYGEAMDRADKATNKAMSAAYKYAAFMAFAIPTDGDNDADASTLDVAAKDEPTISDDQLAQLKQLIPAAKLTPGQFCQTMKCKTVADLPASKFGEATERLNTRLAEIAKQESNKEAAHA